MVKVGNLYLITGGSGFLGEALVARLLDMGAKVRIMARSEAALVKLKFKYPQIEIMTGDICDTTNVKQAMIGVSGVFHLAAFKHVGLAEIQSRECIRTNVIGSMNILEEAIHSYPDFVLGISTDKAAQVVGTYGASKLLMEKMFTQYQSIMNHTKLRIVRYGNVLYSTGSVLCKWKQAIESGGKLVVTDPHATRFYWTVDQAIDLIFKCLEYSTDTTPYCPMMKSLSVGDLLEAMIKKYGNGSIYEVETIGLQVGENLHEKILESGPQSNEVDRYTIDEIVEMI